MSAGTARTPALFMRISSLSFCARTFWAAKRTEERDERSISRNSMLDVVLPSGRVACISAMAKLNFVFDRAAK